MLYVYVDIIYDIFFLIFLFLHSGHFHEDSRISDIVKSLFNVCTVLVTG